MRELGEATAADTWIFYSPIDNVHAALAGILNAAKHSVVVAALQLMKAKAAADAAG